MELSISQKTKEPLLSRMRVCGEIAFDAITPSKEEVRKAVASAVKADEKLVVVKKVHGLFGLRKASFDVCVYDDDKVMAATEPRHRKKGDAAAPAQEKKEEKAAEHPKKEEKGAEHAPKKEEEARPAAAEKKEEKADSKEKKEGHAHHAKKEEKAAPEKAEAKEPKVEEKK